MGAAVAVPIVLFTLSEKPLGSGTRENQSAQQDAGIICGKGK